MNTLPAAKEQISKAERIQKRYADARQAISDVLLREDNPKEKEIDLSAPYRVGTLLLGDYVTLDWKHREDILRVIRTMNAYADDRSLRRPLNVMMRAEPGSGKSYFVKCLARRLASHSATAIDFNMAGLQDIEDLVVPLDEVRNQKVLDRLPILFLDEFDSNPSKYPMLLPLLWDGELHVAHRDLKLGKLVIILAGSSSRIEQVMKDGKAMQKSEISHEDKLADLLSRINGGELEIPSLELMEQDRDRRIDKVCLSIALLQQRFNQNLEWVPWVLLRFIVTNKFRYGVRSIAHLIDCLSVQQSPDETIHFNLDSLPLDSVQKLKDSSLAYHLLAEDGPAGIIDQWKRTSGVEAMIRIRVREDDH